MPTEESEWFDLEKMKVGSSHFQIQIYIYVTVKNLAVGRNIMRFMKIEPKWNL